MNKQLSIYFEEILSKFQYSFRKGFSTQHCLLLILEKWKRAVDNNKVFGALLTDLSKAFDCISHDLLIAKLNAYGWSLSALKLVHSYLQNRKQITKIGSSYSLWEKIVSGVPQGSILGPLLFNIFLWDLFLSIENNYLTNYADDTTPYVIGNNPDEVVSELKDITEKLFTWFPQNEMKANLGKCHMLSSSTESLKFEISETVIHNSQSKKLLGVTFDNKLKFEKHIKTICQKANSKLNALARIAFYMELTKRRIVMNAFFASHFNYCPLIWKFHSRNLNKINRLHERCLQVIYNDKTSSSEQLLENDNSVSIHHRNIQTLVIEMYKVNNGLSLEIMKYFKIDKNLLITYVIHLSLQFHLFTVFIIVEHQSLSWALKYGSLFHPLLSRLNLSQDLKNQLKNGNLVTAPADFAKRIYHKLVSYRIKF